MSEQILELLYSYSTKGKIVDYKFLEKLISIVVDFESLDDYVKDFQIKTDMDNIILEEIFSANYNNKKNIVGIASYNMLDKVIYIYIAQMKKYVDILWGKFSCLFNSFEQIFYKNFIICQVILHELEHANQQKIIDCENSLEAQLLKMSCYNHLGNYSNYYIAPNERLAEIKSYQKLINVMAKIKNEVPQLLNYEILKLYSKMLEEYKYENGFVNSPTMTFFEQIKNIDKCQQFDWYHKDWQACLFLTKRKYSLKERLKFGLMIDTKEFYECNEMLQQIRKY